MNNLTNVEAQRVMAVVDEMIQKLQSLAVLSSDLEYPVDLEQLVGADVATALREQRETEKRYLQLVEERSRLAAIKEPTTAELRRLHKATESLKDETHALRRLTRGLQREIAAQGDTAVRLESVQSSPSALVQFIKALEELRKITYAKLVTSVEDERYNEEKRDALEESAQVAASDARILQRQLDSMKRERERESAVGEELIAKLRDEIHGIKSNSDAAAKAMLDKANADEKSKQRKFESDEKGLLKQISDLQLSLDELTQRHLSGDPRESEAVLRKELRKSEQKVVEWIEKYDTELRDKQQELESLQEVYRGEKEQLEDVRTKLASLQDKHRAMVAVEQSIAGMRAARRISEFSVSHCAKRIQRWARVVLKARKKKKKGGKKGKKGAKGGKKRAKKGAAGAESGAESGAEGEPAGPHLTEEQQADVDECFTLFDVNMDGTISAREIAYAMRCLGEVPDEAEIAELVRRADENADGRLNKGEFTAYMAHKMQAEYDHRMIGESFKVFDRDGSGKITAEELLFVLTTLGETLSEDEVLDLIRDADVDGDGLLAYDEFVAAIFGKK